ncbi:MAG: chromosome segregation ATPase [Candidatus Midichloriaceae bacterium]
MKIKSYLSQERALSILIKNVKQEIDNVLLKKKNLENSIMKLQNSLDILLDEIENEQARSGQFIYFEFDKFFEVSKKRVSLLKEEIEKNKKILNNLLAELHTKFSKQKKYEILLEDLKVKIKHIHSTNEQNTLDEINSIQYVKVSS